MGAYRGIGVTKGRNVGKGGNYDQEAFTKAWDYLASSFNDGEEVFCFPFFPRNRAEIPRFSGRLFFFAAARPRRVTFELKIKTFQLKKTWNISIKLSPEASDTTVKGPCKHNRLLLMAQRKYDFVFWHKKLFALWFLRVWEINWHGCSSWQRE